MIIVTGTKRSGTSMWMQILHAAGFQVFGAAFPSTWGDSIREANPQGFYESVFRRGIYYATNPDPKTGNFVSPAASRAHAVKVFIPGLIRTDLAFIGPVVATLRDWRAYGASLRRLQALEDRWGQARPLRDGETEETRAIALREAQGRRGTLPAEVEWWVENYELIRDVAVRQYPFQLVTYDRVLADPEVEVKRVLSWLGRGDGQAAAAAVLASSSGGANGELNVTVEPETASFFDEIYDSVHRTGGLSKAHVDRMNVFHRGIMEHYRGKKRDDRGDEEAEG